jgi:hypothetical protein
MKKQNDSCRDLICRDRSSLSPLHALLGHEDNPGEKILTPLLEKLGYSQIEDIDRKPSFVTAFLGLRIGVLLTLAFSDTGKAGHPSTGWWLTVSQWERISLDGSRS